MTTNKDWQEQGINFAFNEALATSKMASAALYPSRLVDLASTGKVSHAAAGSKVVLGANRYEVAANEYAWIVTHGPAVLEADIPITAGKPIKAGANGSAIGFIDSTIAGGTMKTTGAGEAFTNQPANDGVTVVSDDNGDTTQTVTIIGTTNGSDTVVVEEIALTGTTDADSTKTDWGVILAVKIDASCAGTVEVSETSGGLEIVSLTTGVLSAGVETITGDSQRAFNQEPTIVCSGTGTKQIGLKGTNSAGATIYDSQALNGATAVTANSAFQLVTEVYTGDLEATRTATLAVGAADSDEERVGFAEEAQDTAGGIFRAVLTRR